LGFPHRAGRCRPGGSPLYMYGRIYDPRMGPHYPRLTLALFSSPRQSAIGRWGSGFHTVRGGVDPGDHRLRPRAVGVVDIRRDFFAEDGDLSSPGASGSWGSPEGHLPPRAPRPLSDQGRGGGGASANWIWARKTLA